MERKFLPRKLANSRVFPSSSPSLSFSLLFSFLFFFLELTLPRLVPSSSFFISCPLSPRDASKSYCVPGDRVLSGVIHVICREHGASPAGFASFRRLFPLPNRLRATLSNRSTVPCPTSHDRWHNYAPAGGYSTWVTRLHFLLFSLPHRCHSTGRRSCRF